MWLWLFCCVLNLYPWHLKKLRSKYFSWRMRHSCVPRTNLMFCFRLDAKLLPALCTNHHHHHHHHVLPKGPLTFNYACSMLCSSWGKTYSRVRAEQADVVWQFETVIWYLSSRQQETRESARVWQKWNLPSWRWSCFSSSRFVSCFFF